MPHKPVLLKETLEFLSLRPGDNVVDGTIGGAGHAVKIVEEIGPQGRLIGLDQDPASVSRAQIVLRNFPQVSLHHENFKNIGKILDSLNIPLVNAVLIDVGFCQDQIEDHSRGFSFYGSGPLDMRMNPDNPLRAVDLIHDLSETELENLFREYGNERRSRRFASAICEERKRRRIETTDDLVNVLERALPGKHYVKKGRRPPGDRHHPATKVFQALRIAVNDELRTLGEGLPAIWNRIQIGGRLAVITFHSLEDRIVKDFFRELKRHRKGIPVTRKAVKATYEEVKQNRRARSARLRVAEKGYEGDR